MDTESRVYTQGFSDVQPSEQVDIQRTYTKNLPASTNEEFRLSKLLRRRLFPFLSQLLDSEETIMPDELEKGILGGFKQQQDISLQTRERLSEKNEKSLKYFQKTFSDIELWDRGTKGKYRTTLLEEQIAHRNVLEEILALKGRHHTDYYDLLYHPKTGVMMKPESELTEYEKNHVLGYSQDIKTLGKIEPYKLAKKLMENNENFVNWFYMNGKASAISVNVDGKILPKLVHHGTVGRVSPVIGFWDRHMGMDERVISGIKNIESEAEKASHFGTLNQAVDIVLNQGLKAKSLSDYGRSKWDTLHNAVYYPDKDSQDHLSQTNEAKFYSGWVKMNKPLRMEDIKSFEFDNILQYLAGKPERVEPLVGMPYTQEKESLMKDFTYSILPPKNMSEDDILKDFQNKGTDFPLLVDHFGQGTALEQVLNYARELYEEDMNRTGVELDDWNEEWGNMSKGEQASIHYYKMHGLIKFIQQDLGYDGIIYENEVEDAEGGGDDSYILFHPWQFKSMYNKGTFSKKRNFLSKTKRKNKYQKVA